MKKLLILVFGVVSLNLYSQNLTLRAHYPYANNLSNLWGYTDTAAGREYALVGTAIGLSIVDVTTPTAPVQKAFVPGPNSIWREVKEWNGYAYVTTEENSTLQIVDLHYLPDSVRTYDFNPLGTTSQHTDFIDENGILYINGADEGVGGIIFCDLNVNPTNPPVIGVFDRWYVHDCFARGDTLYACHILDGFYSIVDASDKTTTAINDPSNTLATQITSLAFTHNCWLSDDSKYLFTTDEKPNSFLDAYDVSDPADIKKLDRIQTRPGSNTIVHNTYYLNGFLITSYYTEGVTIHDASRPHNLIEVGHYDTSPFSGETFNGCWGVYPYFGSGNIIASDIEEGLFIFSPNYVNACWLEGTITDSISGLPLLNAKAQIVGYANQNDSSDLNGFYATGLGQADTVDVVYSRSGYYSKTLSGVILQNGVLNVQDVTLVPKVPFNYTGKVIDEASNASLSFVQVLLQARDGSISYSATTDFSGEFTISGMYEGDYDVYAGRWDHITRLFDSVFISNTSIDTVYEIQAGYYDDFLFDFFWTETSSASSGDWEWADPVGTTYAGDPSHPEDDWNDDFGINCYSTGNGGGSAGTDDVDNGVVTLSTPSMDLSGYTDPYINFYWWFVNTGGTGATPNDTLHVFVDNGSSGLLNVAQFTRLDPMAEWNHFSFKLSDYCSTSTNVKVSFSTSDFSGASHLVEAAIDKFVVVDDSSCIKPVAVDDISINTLADVCTDTISVLLNDLASPSPVISILSVSGGFTASVSGTDIIVESGSDSSEFQVSYEVCNGCGLCDTAFVNCQFKACFDPSLIPSVPLEAQLDMLPNPFNDYSVVRYQISSFNPASIYSLEISNALGQQQNHFILNQASGELKVGESLIPGAYIIELREGIRSVSKIRFVKQ